MKILILFIILLSFNSFAEIYNIKLIKQNGVILYSNDGGRTWKNYREITEKYYTNSNEISISKSIDSEVSNIRMFDYNGNTYNNNLVSILNDKISINLPKSSIYFVQINFDKIHYTFVINNIK